LQLLLDTAKLGAAKRRHLTKFIDEFAPLHYAVHASYPNPEQGSKINYFLSFDNYVNVYTLKKIGEKCKARNLEDSEGSASLRYGGKKGCVNLLLQAGVDIWQRDKNGYIADPGFDAPDEARLWWYDKITKEKYRAKTKINAAGTATAVVAALIASSSFNAHFSPLTSYDSDMNYHEPTTKVLVKIFVITNCISFYVAMTSIMLAIVPSFPLAQEGLREELARSRSAVRKAIRALLLSIASFIVSFIFSSIAVVPNELSYKLLPIISAVLGGISCIYGFVRVFSQESKFH
jgi:biotin operon repressor